MKRVAVFVDAGYLFAQGSTALLGRKSLRGQCSLDYTKMVDALICFATRVSSVPLLRIYWYDGTSTGPSAQHLALAFMDNVKVRLGFVNNAGQQKGVDSLIVTDMIALAQNHAISDAVLLSGDEDIRVGVQQAQAYGVRVHLLGITPCRGSQSSFLIQEADTTHEWKKDDVALFLKPNLELHQPDVPVSLIAQPPQTRSFADLAQEVAGTIAINEHDAIIKGFEADGRLPQEVDRPLLGRAGKALGRLSPKQLTELRKAFIDVLKRH